MILKFLKLTNLSFLTNEHVHFDYRLRTWMTHVFFDFMGFFIRIIKLYNLNVQWSLIKWNI
jgi:hypothetical protein